MPWIAVLFALTLTEIGTLDATRAFVARVTLPAKAVVAGVVALILAAAAWHSTGRRVRSSSS